VVGQFLAICLSFEERRGYNSAHAPGLPPSGALFIMDTACKHSQVRVVAREDDIEFVECQFCGEVFDANEFHDMEIEEKVQAETGEDE